MNINNNENQGSDKFEIDDLESESVSMADKIEEAKPERNLASFLKQLFVFFLLAGVIVASFWVSFNIGRNLLVPAAKPAEKKVETALKQTVPAETTKTTQETTKKEASKPAAVKKASSKPATTSSIKRKYYKVQAGFFKNKLNAINFAKKISETGFGTYIKKMSTGWRVQAGAFVKKTQAQNMQRLLMNKGFKSVLVYE
jgi:cytoskeletal protein RodZ